MPGEAPLSEADGMQQPSSQDPLLQTLQTVFKHENFRDGQREIIEKVTAGQDGVVLLPTGGGKTLCFTLPAILSPGLSIVVLPTLSLMQDLHSRLINICETVCIYGLTGEQERHNILRTIRNPHCAVKLLLITPESLQDSSVLSTLENCNIARFVIDEAHCIDEWGHQFRPSYLTLGQLKTKFDVQIVAFTALHSKLVRISRVRSN
jgi:ATP-dependent DNA helicase RecQ